MKNLFKMTAVAVLVIALMSCDLGGDEKDSGGVDWKSYNSSGAFGIHNNTTEDLVAFKGSITSSMLVGGVRAGTKNHMFKRNTKLFNRSEDFPLYLVTKADYQANKKDLQSLQENPFTRIYIFYNHDTEAERVYYDISGKLGGEGRIFVQNGSGMNVEFRIGGVGGEILGYAPGNMGAIYLGVKLGDLAVYPVFKYFNSVRGTVSTIFPKNASNQAYFRTFSVSNQLLTLNVEDILKNMGSVSKSLGAAWLVIDNATSNAIQLQIGNIMVTNSMGARYTNPGTPITYQVDMQSTTPGVYLPSRNINNFQVGVEGYMVDIVAMVDGVATKNLTLLSDKSYNVSVTGDHNAAKDSEGYLKAVIINYDEPDDVSFDDVVF